MLNVVLRLVYILIDFFQDIGRATAESHSEMSEGPLLNHRDVGGATAESQRFRRGHY